jgi:hypothetical protein
MILCLRDLREARMRGSDTRTGELFSYVDLEKRVPAKHPLRAVRRVVNDVLAALDGDFSRAYADSGSNRSCVRPLRHFTEVCTRTGLSIRQAGSEAGEKIHRIGTINRRLGDDD